MVYNGQNYGRSEKWVEENSREYGYERTGSDTDPNIKTELEEQENQGNLAMKMLASRMLGQNKDWIFTPEEFCDPVEAARDATEYWHAFNHQRVLKNDLKGYVESVIDQVTEKNCKTGL